MEIGQATSKADVRQWSYFAEKVIIYLIYLVVNLLTNKCLKYTYLKMEVVWVRDLARWFSGKGLLLPQKVGWHTEFNPWYLVKVEEENQLYKAALCRTGMVDTDMNVVKWSLKETSYLQLQRSIPVVLMISFYYQFGTTWRHLGRGNLGWEAAWIRLACGCICEQLSWLNWGWWPSPL